MFDRTNLGPAREPGNVGVPLPLFYAMFTNLITPSFRFVLVVVVVVVQSSCTKNLIICEGAVCCLRKKSSESLSLQLPVPVIF